VLGQVTLDPLVPCEAMVTLEEWGLHPAAPVAYPSSRHGELVVLTDTDLRGPGVFDPP